MMNLLKFIAARMDEPSTYASIAGMLVLLNINVSPGLMSAISLWGGIGSGVLGIILSETAGGKTKLQIAQDAFQGLINAVRAMPPAPPAPPAA
jgi:hypothetical protein